jgi:hypothetical protein
MSKHECTESTGGGFSLFGRAHHSHPSRSSLGRLKQTIQHGHKTTSVPFLVHPAKNPSRYCRTSYD